MDKSGHLLLLASILLPLGLFLIPSQLPDTASPRAQVIVQWTPTVVGVLALIYGCIGMATAWSGKARKGSDAIDLKIASSGITVRGGHKIPWESISRVTSIRHDNNSRLKLLWDRADLNCALEIRLDESVDLPLLRTKDGVPCLKIDVVRYPAVDYMPLYESFIHQFERRGIPVDTETKLKQRKLAEGFTSSSSHYWPRMDKSIKNLIFGNAMLLPGLYLALNDLPRTGSYLSQIRLSGILTAAGGMCVIFGCIGLVTALTGAARKGENAIDLKLSSKGISVRGGHTIPWDSISRVTSIQYYNYANIQLMWDRADLNRAFEIHLKEPQDIPGLKTKDGVPRLKIKVVRYPAVDYVAPYESVITEFERRRIPVDIERKTKET